jgi:hypothetical protein
MADGVAIISVIASSTVAVAAVAAQVWQSHLDRESERRAWLRDQRAQAYVSAFQLFEKTPDQVSQQEWEHLMATLRAFASPRMAGLFKQWGDAAALTWQEDLPGGARQKAYADAESFQRQMETQVAVELQGHKPDLGAGGHLRGGGNEAP